MVGGRPSQIDGEHAAAIGEGGGEMCFASRIFPMTTVSHPHIESAADGTALDELPVIDINRL